MTAPLVNKQADNNNNNNNKTTITRIKATNEGFLSNFDVVVVVIIL